MDNAFDPANTGAVQLIVLMRIYDVLMMLLTEQNPKAASDLLKIHGNGNIMGATPWFDGTFIFEELNPEQGSNRDSTEDIPPA